MGGGGFTPEPSRGTDVIEQGETEEPLRTGRYRPITDAGPEATVDEPSPVTPQPFRLTPPGPPSARLLAAGPLTLFGASDVGVPPRTAEPQEPTTAVGKNVAVFTGNTSVGFSLDGGATWTRMDPSTILKDPAGQPLCCDQLVTYSKAQNMFVWLLQYWCTPGTSAPASNDCRNARDRVRTAPHRGVEPGGGPPVPEHAHAWTGLAPPLPLAGVLRIGGSTWFDRSDIGVNSAYLNFTTDVIRSGDSTASLLGRMSLAEIKATARRRAWITETIPRMTVAQGTDTAWTYFAGAVNLSQTRIWDWAPNGSAQVFPHNIDHDTIPVLNGAINGTDGADWYARWSIFAGAVESAVWKGNELIVSQGTGRDECTDKCGTGSDVITHVFDHPGAYISRFNTNDWTLASDRWLRLKNTNIGWPFLALAEDGTVGATFVGAPDGGNPRPIAAFLDERKYVYALAAGQPQGGGDYYSLRPGRTSSSFVIPVRSERDRRRRHHPHPLALHRVRPRGPALGHPAERAHHVARGGPVVQRRRADRLQRHRQRLPGRRRARVRDRVAGRRRGDRDGARASSTPTARRAPTSRP